MSRRYEAPPADVWDAWTNLERTPRWFSAVPGDLREGGAALEDFLGRLGALLTGGDPGAVSEEESQRILKPPWAAARS